VASPSVVRGRSAVVLVAPHAGRRDPVRRPWGSAPLKMNDLHTGALTRILAARLDASALVHEADRNEVDCNRVSAAHDAAPGFLDAFAELVDELLRRHPRVSVLTVHGWNVVQPAVDLGLGVRPSAAVLGGGRETAVSPAFASTTLLRLAAALGARGITATPGLRYPARGRENLVQLFTGRYADDPRPAVRRLARTASRVDAVQLELALPLRLPGPWREAFVDACAQALGNGARTRSAGWPAWHATACACEPLGLEFVAPGLSGLAALDQRGGRLLLFPDDGRLLAFIGERIGVHAPDGVAGLRMTARPEGQLTLRYHGPMLSFPDTTPFLDLECGLAAASTVAARVELAFMPRHRDGDRPCGWGAVRGRARIGEIRHRVHGHGTCRELEVDGQARVAVRLADGAVVVAHGRRGIVCRDGRHTLVDHCTVDHDGTSAAHVAVALAGGGSLEATLAVAHRLPVVPGVPGRGRFVFATCREAGRLAGWIQVRS
jgi:hypothetical protein